VKSAQKSDASGTRVFFQTTFGAYQIMTNLSLPFSSHCPKMPLKLSSDCKCCGHSTTLYHVFVYGSLLKGFHNHHNLNNSEFICRASIRANLFTSNGAWPFIILSNSNKCRVLGEIYLVSKNTLLNRLDYLEGYRKNDLTHSLFIRKQIIAHSNFGKYSLHKPEIYNVIAYEGGQSLRASTKQAVTSGDWQYYKAGVKHT
jgi:gamma-glutamylcyclotransferase (GGCT)/AIG2-like uncharacterized protein YtfP